jgi:hypothetical protein
MSRFGLIGICCLLTASQISCLNPFAPKLDTTLGETVCSDLTDVENIFCVFRNAYSFKDTSLYGSIIGSGFIFSFRDYDQGVDVSWGRDDEMRSTYGLFQSVQSLNLVWNNEISSDSGATSRTIIRGFNLTVTFNPGDIERVDGYANLTFTRKSAADSWQIVHWRDESNY